MSDDSIAVADLGFEEALSELEEIVGRLEAGHGTLDEAIQAYERGSALKRHLQEKLEAARMRVEQIRLAENGTPTGATDFPG